MSYLKGRLAAAILLAVSAAALSLAGSAAPSRAAAATPVTTAPNSFMPGLPWVDKGGHLIQGHDGSVIKDGSTYYWIGQDLLNGGRVAAACYESTDLLQWKFDGDILSVAPNSSTPTPPGGGLPPPTQEPGKTITYMMGSTQVMYDAVTNQYFVWAGVSVKGRDSDPRPSDDFLLAVAETPAGATPCSQSYSWVRGPFQPFGQPAGDLGLFNYTPKGGPTYSYLIDADQGELSCSEGDANCYDPQKKSPGSPDTSTPCDMGSGCLTGPELRVFLMTPPNATPAPPSSGHGPDTSLQGTVLDEYGWFEAPAMFRAGGTFFLLASHKTSWRPNANEYNYSASPPPTSGPFSPTAWGGWQTSALQGSDNGWRDVVPASNPSPTAPYTCDSQTFFVLPVQGTNTGAKTTYIYMGDRWDSSNIGQGTLGNSGYVWLPLQVTTSTLALDCTIDNWSLNFSTGASTPLSDPTFTFTNVGNTLLIDGKSDGSLTQDQLLGTSPTMNQQWKIINVPGVTTGALYAPWYEIQNAATSGDIVQLCQIVNSQCSTYLNPLQQSMAPIPPGDGWTYLWQFGSVNGGPSLTLANFANGDLVDAQTDGTLFQDPSANPPAASQQWALTCATNCG